jgi:4a-hydroxytetrahydrobiopterin dehydratase
MTSEHIAAPAGWNIVDGALQRTFRFPDFAQALAFVVRVGEAAEAASHHPDVELGWGRATVRWTTHDAGGITTRDTELAERTSTLAG